MQQTGINGNRLRKNARIYICAAAFIVWFALALQFVLSVPALMRTGHSLAGAVIQILSFFTIQSNLLVGVCLLSVGLGPGSRWYSYFSKAYVTGGITLYIIIVGLVYNLILRSLWHPEGWFKLADELLHSINPLLFIIYWLIFSPRESLKWKQVLNWLWFPFLYLVYTLVRGCLTGFYPYPFVDAGKLGYGRVAFNSVVMLVAFLILGLLIVWLFRLLNPKKS